MKQFNLEEYLKNPSKKVVTRDGRNVRIICTDAKLESTPIVAMVDKGDGNKESLVTYTKDGKFMGYIDANCDLFFASKKHEGWMNVYRDRDTGITNLGVILYTSREEAEEAGEGDIYYVSTAKIEWEE